MIYLNLLIIFLVIIFIHELGHYSTARFFNTTVTDFSIGFGKVLYQFKDKNLTNWKISLIPLGGYVKIKGLESIFNNTNIVTKDKDSFENLNLIKKITILVAGSFFNIISAWLCLFFIFFFAGIVNFPPIIGSVIDNSPAAINELKEGDLITSINGKKINNFNQIGNIINKSKNINIIIIRGNQIISKEFDLSFNKNLNKYIIGITSTNTPSLIKYDFFISLKTSIMFIPTYYRETLNHFLKSYKNNTLTNDLAGPVGMVKMADKLMLDKIKGVLFIYIIISLFVGLFNLFPIPLLDGGHIVYFSVRYIFSNKIPAFITKLYLTVGITIITFLFLIVTFNDIFNK